MKTFSELKKMKLNNTEIAVKNYPGLYVRFLTEKHKSFYFKKKIDKKILKLKIGNINEISFNEANNKRLAILNAIKHAKDFDDAKKIARTIIKTRITKDEKEEEEKLKKEEIMYSFEYLVPLYIEFLKKQNINKNDIRVVRNYFLPANMPILKEKTVKNMDLATAKNYYKQIKKIKKEMDLKGGNRRGTAKKVKTYWNKFYKEFIYEQIEDAVTNFFDVPDFYLDNVFGKIENKEIDAITKIEEFRKLYNNIKNAKRVNFNYKNFVLLQIYTAQRFNSLAELRWGDIDFKNKHIILLKNKTTKKFVIPMVDHIEKLLKEQHKKAAKTGKDDYVFVNTKFNKVLVNSANTFIKRECKKAGVKEVSSHSFRTTFLTLSPELDAPGLDDMRKILTSDTQLQHQIKQASSTFDRYFRNAFEKDRKKLLEAWYDYLEDIKKPPHTLPYFSSLLNFYSISNLKAMGNYYSNIATLQQISKNTFVYKPNFDINIEKKEKVEAELIEIKFENPLKTNDEN